MRPRRMLFVYLSCALQTSANLIPSSTTTTGPAELFSYDNIGLADLFPDRLQGDASSPITPILQNVNPQSLEIDLPNSHDTTNILDKEDERLYTAIRTARGAEGRRRQPHELRAEPTPPPVQALKDNSMCIFLGAALGICNSLTSGFTTMGPSVQAQCLCYSSAAWSPNIFDNAVGECAAFASTAAPLAYEPLANLEGFCSSIGDVKAPKSTAVMTTSSPSPTNINTGCDLVSKALVSCAGKDEAFEGLDATGKAKCLCYNSITSWRPTQFDNAVKTCAEDAYFSTSLPSVQSLAGLCGGIGNVLDRSTLTPSATPSSMDDSSDLTLSSLEDSTLFSTSIFPNPTNSDSEAPNSQSSTSPANSITFLTSPTSVQPSSIFSTPDQTPSNPNTPSPSTPGSSQTSTTTRYIPTTFLSTQTPTQPPTGTAVRGKVEEWEIILVSFCCAMVLLFLC